MLRVPGICPPCRLLDAMQLPGSSVGVSQKKVVPGYPIKCVTRFSQMPIPWHAAMGNRARLNRLPPHSEQHPFVSNT
eukprot:487630-Pelagomonas_calceolata.AAC.9